MEKESKGSPLESGYIGSHLPPPLLVLILSQRPNVSITAK